MLKRRFSIHIVLAIVAVGVIIGVASAPRKVLSQSGSSLRGWAWSDTVGWISVNCLDTSSCTTVNYHMDIDQNGIITGWAWSDAIGWIRSDPTMTGCPGGGSCGSSIVGGTLTGWWRAISPTQAALDSGWDGWISLSGTSPSYGPLLQANGYLLGFLWGGMNVGWVDSHLIYTDFEPCQASYTCDGQTIVYHSPQCTETRAAEACVTPAFCSVGSAVCLVPTPEFNPGATTSGHLQARPTVVRPGDTSTLFWSVSNVNGCTVTGTNGDSWSDISSGVNGKQTSAILASVVYHLHCDAYEGAFPSAVDESVDVRIAPNWKEL